jgi:hypothetical protein
MSAKAVDKLTSAEAEKVEERFTAGERNSPVGYFEVHSDSVWTTPRLPRFARRGASFSSSPLLTRKAKPAWASGARP